MADVVDKAKDPVVAVIGCGNSPRSDDGIGAKVVRALTARPVARDPRVRLLDAGTDGMAVMFAARGCSSVIIIDACRSGAEPGAVFEIPGVELERVREPSLTLHDFRWDHAIYAGKRMFGETFPSPVVLLVEAQTLDFGLVLSAAVAARIDQIVDRVETLVHAGLEARP